jgi:hypothetical protein
MKKSYEITFNQIIDQNDLEDGNIILLTSRPCMGKTYTCNKIINKYYDKYKMIYFDLSGGDLLYRLEQFNIYYHKEYFCAHEIIKYIQQKVRLTQMELRTYFQTITYENQPITLNEIKRHVGEFMIMRGNSWELKKGDSL